MDSLFSKWRQRTSLPVVEDTMDVQSDELDKKTKMLLNSVIYTNRKHQKQNIPLDYTFDEESKSFEKVDVMGTIAPFTTDKGNLYESLERDLIAFKNSSKKRE